MKHDTFYTDYPFVELGDIECEKAPIRSLKILEYDGDKYCLVDLLPVGRIFWVKTGYIYRDERRHSCKKDDNINFDRFIK
jgi:hypothetical protein